MILLGSGAGKISRSYPKTLHYSYPGSFHYKALSNPSSVSQVTKAVTGVYN